MLAQFCRLLAVPDEQPALLAAHKRLALVKALQIEVVEQELLQRIGCESGLRSELEPTRRCGAGATKSKAAQTLYTSTSHSSLSATSSRSKTRPNPSPTCLSCKCSPRICSRSYRCSSSPSRRRSRCTGCW